MARLDSMRLPSARLGTHVAGAFVAALSLHRPALAIGCTLIVHTSRPSPGWQAAADELRPALEDKSGDCASVELIVEENGAHVVFTTKDGRKAVRLLHEPRDLEPTVSALLVELPQEESAAKAPAAPPPVEPSRNAVAPAPVSSQRVHLILNAEGGARLAGPGPLIGGTVGLGATMSVSGWDVGVGAIWCPSYGLIGDSDDFRPATISSLGAGVLVGRREHVGRSMMLLAGANLSAAFEHESWKVTNGDGASLGHETERGQMLVGLYGGVVFPAKWKTRIRSTLGVDLDATHAGRTATTVEGAPELPWWGVSLAVGVESEAL